MSDRLYLTGQSAAQIRESMASYGLTPRESECAWLYIHGYTYDEIASALEMSPNTARALLARVSERCGYDAEHGRSPIRLLRRLLSPLVMLPMWMDAA